VASMSDQFNAAVRRASARVYNRSVRSLVEPAHPVKHLEEQSVAKFCVDAAVRPVTCDRTCLVMKFAL
jgi:hypothetical protein